MTQDELKSAAATILGLSAEEVVSVTPTAYSVKVIRNFGDRTQTSYRSIDLTS